MLLLLVLLSMMIGGCYQYVQFMRVDTCFDHGGRWNYTDGICEK